MGLGAVGAKALPLARPLPPMQSARPVPWLGPCPLPSPCQETPASTALHLCLCHHPLSPPSLPQPLPAPRLCAGPVAGTSSARRPAFLFSCNSSRQWAATAQKTLWLPWLLLGRGPSPLSAVFLLTRMGEMNTPNRKHTEQAIIYLFLIYFVIFL